MVRLLAMFKLRNLNSGACPAAGKIAEVYARVEAALSELDDATLGAAMRALSPRERAAGLRRHHQLARSATKVRRYFECATKVSVFREHEKAQRNGES